MSEILRGLDFVLVMIDDILIFSGSDSEHIEHLKVVFDRIQKSNLKLKPAKCHLFRSSIKFLGFVVSKDGILPDPEKIKTIINFPIPNSIKSICRFVRMLQFYS